ncbi:Qat anti-phage system QueC-like protein QatC [Flavobacterium subsaxonicum]|uniref:ATPase n=1 Tax=Flavobacterium subsaxonicum WB 4.1-42 = DSM 21790 TaxID=1121898 RepID=A0A0A2MFE8_9FLAO|nr:Qat anti-phage system QueC-like protein QatC [Flavobacterium subsaxonicum]KGO91014.1 hypothetical protein Q766_20200 [Flavobacterium subsaxonicum WB 4.1-42 = DSM 21790]
MSKRHIIVKHNNADTFQIVPGNNESVTTLSLDPLDLNKMLKSHIYDDLRTLGFTPENTAYDLLHIALAIYTADQTVSRQTNGFQGWSRYLTVYFPVNDKALWDSVKEMLENYIGFLSGDKWAFEFRQNETIRTFQHQLVRNPENYTKVSLLSGGLDSFIGAVDLLSDNEKPYFISHYKTGTESSTQVKIYNALETKFGKGSFKGHKFYVQPNQQNILAEKENSSRARSLLFICLGLTCANCLGDTIEMILPENGLISLNIPLTKTRLSSHSTRTTHPYFVDGLNKIISTLGIRNKITNPYRFKTKGEMMVECKDVAFLMTHDHETISCSHPENSRYAGMPPGLNCGYCVPCIIRQAAENRAGNIKTTYAIGDIRRTPPSQRNRKGSDYRAFKLALQNLTTITKPHSLALQINRSGQIPYNSEAELLEYVSVYKRGMDEVKLFLDS